MKCPFLKGDYVSSCKAIEEIYIPSQFEINEYCRSKNYNVCPLYRQYIDKIALKWVLIRERV